MLDAWTPPDPQQAQILERFQKLFETHQDPTRKDNPGEHLTASALVVAADLDQVMLCLHGRVHRWLQFGGHCEAEDETVVAAALREATEESGVDGLRIDPVPIHLDVHFVQCRSGPSWHFDVRFAAIAPAGAAPVVSDESHDVAWFAPDALPSPMGDATVPLIEPALARFRGTGRRHGS